MAHPRGQAVSTLVDRIQRDDIGGAAEMACEVASALAADLEAIRGIGPAELHKLVRDATRQFLEAAPSVSPVTSVLHEIGAATEATVASGAADVDVVIAACASARSRILAALDAVGLIGGALLRDGERIFTYSTSGSVYAAIRQAVESGKRLSVATTESRPGREGLRTIELLGPLGVPVTMGIDGGVAGLLRDCTSMWVGADTVSSTGDALCKTGTLPAVLAAATYAVPVRVVADRSKYDAMTARGWEMPIRELHARALLTEAEAGHATVSIPLFEVVPARFIESLVTDVGVLPPAGMAAAAGGTMSPLVIGVLEELLAGPRERLGIVGAETRA